MYISVVWRLEFLLESAFDLGYVWLPESLMKTHGEENTKEK